MEIVDLYEPDLVYFDWANGAAGLDPYRKQFASYYYNVAAERSKGVVVTYKNTAYPEHAAVLEIERGLAPGIRELPWPEREAGIKALGKKSKNAPAGVSDVSLLGSGARLKWRQDKGALAVEMPGEKPCDIAHALKITT